MSLHGRDRSGSIMLVDDELDLLEVLEYGLVEEGYRVRSFEDSRDALEDFKSEPDEYSVVVADIRMTPIDGLELAKQILAVRREIRIILMTAMEIRGSISRKLRELPQCKVIRKPFTFSDLHYMLKSQDYVTH